MQNDSIRIRIKKKPKTKKWIKDGMKVSQGEDNLMEYFYTLFPYWFFFFFKYNLDIFVVSNLDTI
jgi:hypothetical protein